MGTDRQLPVERFLPLRPVEFDVLLSLAAGERHGYGIIQDAEARGHMIAPDVTELLPELTLAQLWDLTAEEVARNVHAHPTLSEALKEVAHGISGHMINF